MSQYKNWTPEECQKLAELFPHHPANYVAKVIGRAIGGVYAQAKRMMIEKAPPTELSKTAKIIEACKPDTGLTVGELGKAIGESNDFCNTIAHLLCRERRLFKAGLFKHTRYFVTEESAKAWHTQAHAERDKKQAEAKRKKMDARNKARRLQREKEGKALGKKPEPAKKPTDKKPVPIYITSKSKQPAAPVNAKVVWPEHVKVQAIPTPPPRFAFTPPPGWRGQITHDWMDRRLQGVQHE